jgi:hypothetical protein
MSNRRENIFKNHSESSPRSRGKLYNEIVVKEVPRLRTIRAKLCSERSPKTNNNKHEIIQ